VFEHRWDTARRAVSIGQSWNFTAARRFQVVYSGRQRKANFFGAEENGIIIKEMARFRSMQPRTPVGKDMLMTMKSVFTGTQTGKAR
jgi:hypothetical protein